MPVGIYPGNAERDLDILIGGLHVRLFLFKVIRAQSCNELLVFLQPVDEEETGWISAVQHHDAGHQKTAIHIAVSSTLKVMTLRNRVFVYKEKIIRTQGRADEQELFVREEVEELWNVLVANRL